MRKRYLVMLLPLLVLALASTSYAWQGRMGGMGDPFGLVADESDYLIHPAKIANGKGVSFYGDYRFTFTDVTDWEFFGVFNIPGNELRHNALVGTALPLGPGRMGLFFQYDGIRGDFDGGGAGEVIGLKSRVDDFVLRLLYGLPIGGIKVGGEVQFAYRQEENEINEAIFSGPTAHWLNDDFLPEYLYPYDSHYWEALFKGSLEGKAGPFDLEFTLRGGFLFGSANDWPFEYQSPIGTPVLGWDMKGGVQGWRIGGDFWARYVRGYGLTFPMLVRVDYQQKTWDGHGPGSGLYTGIVWNYEHEKRDLSITAGGGLDKEFGKDARIAVGAYYNYIQGSEEHMVFDNGTLNTSWTIPDITEHRALFRIAGEQRLSSIAVLRGGINGFYGWRIWKEKGLLFPVSADGSHMGFGISGGVTITLKHFTFEPFIGYGYEWLDLDEEGVARSQWNIGGGLSILYDL